MNRGIWGGGGGETAEKGYGGERVATPDSPPPYTGAGWLVFFSFEANIQFLYLRVQGKQRDITQQCQKNS